MPIWIGTSGYSYPEWVGPLYPPDTRPKEMLPFYSRQFPLVELNYTFYRVPTAAQLIRLTVQTPPGFQFLVKLPQTLSHDRNPDDIAAFRRAAEALKERGRLLGLLCQLPQSAHHDRAGRLWIERLARELPGAPLAVEFRHRSWARPDVAPWLAEHGLDLVAVDVPDIPALYPRGLVRSGPRIYVRFHSRKAASWYASGAERYDYDYTDAELTEWADQLMPVVEGAEQILLLFNNCAGGQAPRNARRMQALLAPLLPGELAAPPVAVQRTLFD